MKGGITAFNKENDFLSFVTSYKHIRNNVYEPIKSHFAISDKLNFPSTPTSYKIETLSKIKEDRKEIHIIFDKCMPVANTDDIVAVNKKVLRIRFDLYGIKCSDVCCPDHIASGVIKGMATSRTMNVPEISLCTKHLEQLLNTLKLVL